MWLPGPAVGQLNSAAPATHASCKSSHPSSFPCPAPFPLPCLWSSRQVLHNTYPDKDHLWDGYERLKFVPFNPTDKFTMAVIRDKQTGKVGLFLLPQLQGYRSSKGP